MTTMNVNIINTALVGPGVVAGQCGIASLYRYAATNCATEEDRPKAIAHVLVVKLFSFIVTMITALAGSQFLDYFATWFLLSLGWNVFLYWRQSAGCQCGDS